MSGGCGSAAARGEYYLSQARRDLSEHARQMPLSKDDMAKVEQATRDQIAALLRAMMGKEQQVSVVFTENDVAQARPRPEAAGISDAAAGERK